jgi:tripartite-type tricarboxylate transporter receptor subunit TctC
MRDLTGGLIDYAFQSTIQVVAPIHQKQAIGIAVATDDRITSLPDLPTLKEAGFDDVRIDSWQGIGGPKGLPPNVVQKIGAALNAAAKDPVIVQRVETDQVKLITGSQREFDDLLVSDSERLGSVVRRLKIKAD